MARQIDWRRQFKKLEPYLNGRGGVVDVRYRGRSSGSNAFLSVLKSQFENRPDATKVQGDSIRLDPQNYKVSRSMSLMSGLNGLKYFTLLLITTFFFPFGSSSIVTRVSSDPFGGRSAATAHTASSAAV